MGFLLCSLGALQSRNIFLPDAGRLVFGAFSTHVYRSHSVVALGGHMMDHMMDHMMHHMMDHMIKW